MQLTNVFKGNPRDKANQRLRKTNVLLWVLQWLLAFLFLFAGVMKLVTPLEEAAKQSGLSVLFLQFIGVAETLGAFGLILPGLLRIRPILTPLAAAGLVIIMIGATALTASAFPMVVGLLLGFIAYGRWRLAPHRGPSRTTGSQPARYAPPSLAA
jgi:uncharacterized membrane protein YphA (DoxX/SURF4 family)